MGRGADLIHLKGSAFVDHSVIGDERELYSIIGVKCCYVRGLTHCEPPTSLSKLMLVCVKCQPTINATLTRFYPQMIAVCGVGMF